MAVTISVADLAAATGATTAVAGRLLPVATALVVKYGPDAPDAIQDEAVIRCAGWLAGRNPTGATSEITEVGDWRSEKRHPAAQQGALRYSGAMSLLSPWKVRRAGTIG